MEQLRLGQIIYEGQNVKVYRGTYKQMDVAVKVLSGIPLEVAENEIRTQMSLKHENICRVFDYALKDGCFYIVVEWMEQDLDKVIKQRAASGQYWSSEELWTVFLQLIDALVYAQEANISHRDIKPANIFISSRGGLKIGDFGTAKHMQDLYTNTIIGSPYFFSPEMKWKFLCAAQNLPCDAMYDPFRSDVYSLGMTFLMMILLRRSNGLIAPETLQEELEKELSYVPEEFHWLLREMLRPEARKNFIELQEEMSLYCKAPIGTCQICRVTTSLAVPSRLIVAPLRLCSAHCRRAYYAYYQQNAPTRVYQLAII